MNKLVEKKKKITPIVEFALFSIVSWVAGSNTFPSFGVTVLTIIWTRFVTIQPFEAQFGTALS